MKLSVSLINKFISFIEKHLKIHNTSNNIIILEKIKYFLSLIKASVNILNSTNTNQYSSSEKHFCSVYKLYFEKSEAKLFNISMSFLSSSEQTINKDSQQQLHINKSNDSKPLTPNTNNLYKSSSSNYQQIGSLNMRFHQHNKNPEIDQKKKEYSICNNNISQSVSNFSTPQIKMLKIDN
jgi:hypothetical protein